MPSGDCSSGFMSPEGIYTDIYIYADIYPNTYIDTYPGICTDIYTGKTRENIKYIAYETRDNIAGKHYLFEKRFWN